jgi:hypothetical protein
MTALSRRLGEVVCFLPRRYRIAGGRPESEVHREILLRIRSRMGEGGRQIRKLYDSTGTTIKEATETATD